MSCSQGCLGCFKDALVALFAITAVRGWSCSLCLLYHTCYMHLSPLANACAIAIGIVTPPLPCALTHSFVYSRHMSDM